RELTRTLNEIFGQMGSESEFYFVFAGHGQVRDTGQGEIQFLDGALTRAELYRDVIEPSPAAFNHLIIDACNAYFMVAARGATAAGDYRSLVRSFVAQESLDRFPNTGVLVSTVGDAEVHEWSKIQSGVFTHQLRSALSGAADADRDGRVDYNEVEAFLAAANGKVEDPRARVNVFARAPALNARTAIFSPQSTLPKIEVPRLWSGRFNVEDDRGVRFADFNKTDEVAVTLRVVPRPYYYLRQGHEELRIEPEAIASLSRKLSRDAFTPITLASRGSVQDSYATKLFAVPFGPSFVAGYSRALEGRVPAVSERFEPTSRETLKPYRQAAWIGAGVAAGAAVALELVSRRSADQFERAAGSQQDVIRYEDRANRYRGLAWTSAGLALSAAITA
ncbi:MAG: hypothetical protein AAFY60_19265, partial [Myxococcota bacterium]